MGQLVPKSQFLLPSSTRLTNLSSRTLSSRTLSRSYSSSTLLFHHAPTCINLTKKDKLYRSPQQKPPSTQLPTTLLLAAAAASMPTMTTIRPFSSSSSALSSSSSSCDNLGSHGDRLASTVAAAPLGSTSSSANLQTPVPQGEGGVVQEVDVVYFRGLPQITIPLPSRRELCRFIVKPLTNTVGDLVAMIRHEDAGIDRVSFISLDGTRIASANTIEMLMEQDFEIQINDHRYRVKTPPQEKPTEEELERLSSVRNLVGQLYGALNVDEHQLRRERELISELERLKNELGPLEDKREQLNELAVKRTNTLTWVGLGLMGVQFGVLARLTWWEYSWDIMEPVTYFVTYGTAMLCYAYFVLTRQEYMLPQVADRQYLITFHKNAKKVGLDVDKYNRLKEAAHKIEGDLKRLRDPLALHLPLKTRIVNSQELSSGGGVFGSRYGGGGLGGGTYDPTNNPVSSQSLISRGFQKVKDIFKRDNTKS